MNIQNKYIMQSCLFMAIGIIILQGCKKGNPNNLPSVSPNDYVGKIEGFDSSGEVAPEHLIAYWSFDGTKAESKSGISPTSSLNDSYISNGVRGQALKLDSGYVYFGSQIPALTSLTSFTISEWVQILNNGSTPTLTFTLARPGQFWGNINFLLETGQHPASDTSNLVVHPDYADVNNGTQDNLNANWNPDGPNTYFSPTIGANKWVNLMITYDSATVIFQIYANGRRIGTTSYQQRGKAYFKNTVPNEVIIGGWYNNIPGKQVTMDTWTVPMKGNIDEIRIYNTVLGAADIKALYELGAAGQ